jgi:hypothetical protein
MTPAAWRAANTAWLASLPAAVVALAEARANVVLSAMLFHKVTAITRPEADFLIKSATSSLNACVVVECFGRWYDVRRMTESELTDFVDSLNRDHLNATGLAVTPH